MRSPDHATTSSLPVCYEVALANEPSLDAALDSYMRTKHIPEILATGCFYHIEYQRLGPGSSRTCYYAPSQLSLDHYLAEYTAPMREDFIAHFASGVTVTRTVWKVLQSWN
jgi:hypothetical protein